jgi:hypothetical protein
MTKNRNRRSSGSILLLTVALVAVLFSALMLGIWLFKFTAVQFKQQALAEATALGCAQTLSCIVVEDPHFGFVSLTDQNSGKRTVSHTGESLPVRGINTILANIRQTRLLAAQLNNTPLLDLTEKEFSYAQDTLKLLQTALDAAAQGKVGLARDVNGETVDLYKRAREAYSQCSGQSDLSTIDFEIKLGQLANGGPTITAAPMPERLGAVNQSQMFGCNYMSCVKIACHGLNFEFAPVSSQSTLANVDSFRATDRNQFGSVLKLTVRPKGGDLSFIGASACSVPPAYSVSASYSTLVLDLPMGLSENDAVTFADFLKRDFSGNHPRHCRSENGDFPVDQNCQLAAASGADNFGYTVGELIYDWLRSSNANSPETLKSILDILNSPLETRQERALFNSYCLAFYFDKDAKLHRSLFCRNPFYKGFVSEGQNSSTSTIALSADRATVSLIDDVKNIGTTDCGKHGGQPIDISTIDGPSILATNLADEEAYERSLIGNAVVPRSYPLPYTLRFAGQIQVLDGSAVAN